jgi:hypothetical protein
MVVRNFVGRSRHPFINVDLLIDAGFEPFSQCLTVPVSLSCPLDSLMVNTTPPPRESPQKEDQSAIIRRFFSNRSPRR